MGKRRPIPFRREKVWFEKTKDRKKVRMQKIFNMTFPFLLLLSMLVSVTTSQHHHEEVKEADFHPAPTPGRLPPGTTPWCAKVLNCGFGRVSQRAARMKDSVIEYLKHRINKLDRQMTALQVEFQQRDEELNQKIDRIAAAFKTN